MPRAYTRPHAALCPLMVLALFVFAGAPTCAPARPIFKCTLADGTTTFSDAPCKQTSSQQQLQMRGGTVQPLRRSPEAAAAAAAAAKRAEAGNCYNWTAPQGDVVVDQPGRIDPAQLPHDANGKPVEIFVGKRNPMSVAAACSAMVSACSQKSADPDKAIDACFKSAPRCTTAHPWDEQRACCPQACWQKYGDLRRHCVDPSSASYEALFEDRCVPGSAALQRRSGAH